MRIRHAFVGVVLAFAALFTLSASAAWADTGGLSSQQIAELRSQPLPIVVPSYVPPGFQLVHIEASKGNKRLNSANTYTLKYKSGDGRYFTINVADGEFGDADPDYSSYRRPFTADSHWIGSTKMSPYNFSNGAQQWFYASDYVSLQRLGNSRAILIFSGSLSPDELRHIYSSLTQISR
ncbi:MAG: hypothetical protein JO113_00745 [Candidatus Eremiobacteraeota bacterium]|nr:hypothetical protein [Candidatus Eremiobacteraeota bacterium]